MGNLCLAAIVRLLPSRWMKLFHDVENKASGDKAPPIVQLFRVRLYASCPVKFPHMVRAHCPEVEDDERASHRDVFALDSFPRVTDANILD